MDALPVTPAQTRVLLALTHLERTGAEVSVRGVGGLLGYDSATTTWKHLLALEQAGLAERWAFGDLIRWRSRYRIVA